MNYKTFVEFQFVNDAVVPPHRKSNSEKREGVWSAWVQLGAALASADIEGCECRPRVRHSTTNPCHKHASHSQSGDRSLDSRARMLSLR